MEPPKESLSSASISKSEPGTYGLSNRRRATLSLSDLRTPLVENIMSMLPTGHDKAFKYALYNVLAMVLAAGCIIAFWAAYCILEPFIGPLLWALLCGSVIHPFKDRLVTFTREWLGDVKASSIPLTVQLAFIPVRAIDSVSEGIGSRVLTWWKCIGGGAGVFLLTYVIYHNPPATLGWILYWIGLLLLQSLLWIISWVNGTLVLSISALYLFAVVSTFRRWQTEIPAEKSKRCHVPDGKEKNEPEADPKAEGDQPDKKVRHLERRNSISNGDWFVQTTAMLTWFAWLIYICEFLPFFLLIFAGISFITGSAIYVRRRSYDYSLYTVKNQVAMLLQLADPSSSRAISRKSSLQYIRSRKSFLLQSTSGTPATPVTPVTSDPDMALSQTPVDILRRRTKPTPIDLNLPGDSQDCSSTASSEMPPNCSLLSQMEDDDEDVVDGLLDSNKFLYGVLCACFVVQAWNHFRIVYLLPIPVAYFGLKRLCIYFGLVDYLETNVHQPLLSFYCSKAGQDLFPHPVRLFLRIIYEADRKFVSVFESYLDMIATIVILVAVMVVSVILLLFVLTQFYAEGDHLVRVGANVINSTVSQYPEFSQLLPEGWESLTGSLVGNAYHYGRDYIKTLIRDSVAERNPEKAEEMERQVIELWDRIYMSWNRTWGTFENSHHQGDKGIEWNDFVKTGQNVTEGFDYGTLMHYAKSNFGQVRSVLESAWSVLIGNVSLAVSVITSILSVLFGGGSALLNLIISFVVFVTALFYLLSASTSVYKPVELFNMWLSGEGTHANSFMTAIEESVSGVFSATLKMSTFYGLWTWLIHTLFQVNIVFVPSFFAAIFAAVPLLMPYWAVFPAVLELWLIQGHWTKALLMLIAQMLPMSVVDAQIYSEIKGGGHPYLTALAVAGGIFYFGFQGAIIGPVVLCFLFVAVKVGSAYMKEGTNFDFPPIKVRNEC